MIAAIIILSATAFVATLLAAIIYQKALAYKDGYRQEAALSELLASGTGRAKRPPQAQSTRLRKIGYVRRKAIHAYGHYTAL